MTGGSIDIAFVGSISTADGSALVRLGDTTIVCGVKAEIAEPELDRPGQGFLGKWYYEYTTTKHSPICSFIVPNLDLPAICSPKFKPGPPTEEAQVLSDRLNEALVVYASFGPNDRQTSSLTTVQLWSSPTIFTLHTSRQGCLGTLC